MARIAKSEREEVLQATRRRLLDAAVVEIAREGFAAANINTISEMAGFSKGTIYNYFASKQDLLLALIADAGALHVEFIAGAVRQEREALPRLEAFYRAGFRFVEEFPAQARFLITTLYSPGTEVQTAMLQAYLPMFQLVAEEIIAFGIGAGVFRAVQPLETANLLMTLYLGSASHIDQTGKVYMDPGQVADFARHALLRVDRSSNEGE